MDYKDYKVGHINVKYSKCNDGTPYIILIPDKGFELVDNRIGSISDRWSTSDLESVKHFTTKRCSKKENETIVWNIVKTKHQRDLIPINRMILVCYKDGYIDTEFGRECVGDYAVEDIAAWADMPLGISEY